MVAGPGHGLVGRARKVLNVPGMRGAAFCVVLWRFVLCCVVACCVVLWRVVACCGMGGVCGISREVCSTT